MNRVRVWACVSVGCLLWLAAMAISDGATFNGYWNALWVALICAQMAAW